jgi:hypothetical protein
MKRIETRTLSRSITARGVRMSAHAVFAGTVATPRRTQRSVRSGSGCALPFGQRTWGRTMRVIFPRVFISYVRDNSDAVQRLVHALTAQRVEVWFDQTHLQPGDRWREVIRKEIEQGDFFIACFSEEYSQRRRSFMNEEITQAIEQMRRLPTGQRWFIPVLLSSCNIPDLSISPGVTLRDFQWVALYDNWDDGIQRILDVIMPTQPLEPEMILIPAGKFFMRVFHSENSGDEC